MRTNDGAATTARAETIRQGELQSHNPCGTQSHIQGKVARSLSSVRHASPWPRSTPPRSTHCAHHPPRPAFAQGHNPRFGASRPPTRAPEQARPPPRGQIIRYRPEGNKRRYSRAIGFHGQSLVTFLKGPLTNNLTGYGRRQPRVNYLGIGSAVVSSDQAAFSLSAQLQLSLPHCFPRWP
jgi:hypothetical protein